jgi:hypothetical protein
MKARVMSIVLLLILFVSAACSPASSETAVELPSNPTETRTPQATASPTKTPRATITRAPTLTPTIAEVHLELEIVDSEVWEDGFGNTRIRVSARNPYDFAVETTFRPRATLYDAEGNVLRSQQLLEDGVYGPSLLLPNETHTFHGCFDPCDGGVPVGEWVTYRFVFLLVEVE